MVQCYWRGVGNVSFHKGTLAPPGEYDWTCASFDPLECTTDTAKWIGSVVFAQLMAESAYTLQWGHPYSPELPLSMGDLDLPCNTWCFRPIRVHNPNGTSIGSAVFAQMTAGCLYTLQWFTCFPSKLPLPMLASGLHVIRGSLAPPESGTQMGTSSFQPFLQGWQTETVTERQTDHATQCDAA